MTRTVNTIPKLATAVLMLVTLSSCELMTMHHYALDPNERDPIKDWTMDSDAVVVLVGLYSDQQIQVAINDRIAAYTFLPIRHFGGQDLYPMAFRFKTGETAKLTSVHIGSSSSGLRVTEETLKFENLPAMKLSQPGIYYYGLLTIENKQGALQEEFDQSVIDNARQSYPYVFANMKPVNF